MGRKLHNLDVIFINTRSKKVRGYVLIKTNEIICFRWTRTESEGLAIAYRLVYFRKKVPLPLRFVNEIFCC